MEPLGRHGTWIPRSWHAAKRFDQISIGHNRCRPCYVDEQRIAGNETAMPIGPMLVVPVPKSGKTIVIEILGKRVLAMALIERPRGIASDHAVVR